MGIKALKIQRAKMHCESHCGIQVGKRLGVYFFFSRSNFIYTPSELFAFSIIQALQSLNFVGARA